MKINCEILSQKIAENYSQLKHVKDYTIVYDGVEMSVQNMFGNDILVLQLNTNKFIDFYDISKIAYNIGIVVNRAKILYSEQRVSNIKYLSIMHPSDGMNLFDCLGNFPNLENLCVENIELSEYDKKIILKQKSIKALSIRIEDYCHIQSLGNESYDLKSLRLISTTQSEDEYSIDFMRQKNIVELDLDGFQLKNAHEILKLKKLKKLSILNCEPILPSFIFKLFTLEKLILKNKKMCEVPYEITKLNKLILLTLENIKKLPEDIDRMTNLKHLEIYGSNMEQLPSSIGNLNNLICFVIKKSSLIMLPEEIGNLKNLKEFEICDVLLQSIPSTIGDLSNLEKLTISKTYITSLPLEIYYLHNLIYLDVSYCYLDNLDNHIEMLQKIEFLNISNTKISKLPMRFESLSRLKELDISYTQITVIPYALEQLQSLSRIDLSGLVLDTIPKLLVMNILSNCKRIDEGIILNETILKKMPISLFEQDISLVKAYYFEEQVMIREAKCVFLGDGESGKTYIIERLLNSGKNLPQDFDTELTPGVAIKTLNIQTDNGNVEAQIWDFGGQEILHSMHRCFLTSRTLYIIVLDSRNNIHDERAYYWLNNIQSFSRDCPVIIVLNKMDLNPNASLNETDLRRRFPKLTHILKLSAWDDDQQDFLKLLDAIKTEIVKLDSCGLLFPKHWSKLKFELQNMQENYITDSKYVSMCESASITDKKIQIWLLDWFNDLGVSFSYHKDANDVVLLNYMLLNPRWLTNAIYIIIYCGKKFSKRGLLKQSDIMYLLKNPTFSVEKDIMYETNHIPYIIEVMNKFEISYQIDKSSVFIPALCDRNEIDCEYKNASKSELYYHMKYQYLPNNVIHRLMIKMHDDICFNEIWLTGARFENSDIGCSAIVKVSENNLLISVSSTNDAYEPWIYLTIIRCKLVGINNHLNLKTHDFITYTINGKGDDIPYDDIIQEINDGRDYHYSVKLKKEIKLFDIIKSIEGSIVAKNMQDARKRGEEVDKNMNITNINIGCNSVQSNTVGKGEINVVSQLDSVIELLKNTEVINAKQIEAILELLHTNGEEYSGIASDLALLKNKPKRFKKSFTDWLSLSADIAGIGSLIMQIVPILVH